MGTNYDRIICHDNLCEFACYISWPNEYTLIIYNRWGEIVFKGINEGWDGKSKNRFVEDGIYTYVIIVNDFKDKLFKYTGNLLLIK